METITAFKAFKTEKCEEPLCSCYGRSSSSKLPKNYADCRYYHNDKDKRRPPFAMDGDEIVEDENGCYFRAYDNIKKLYLLANPDGCLNEVEFLYHPYEFKTEECDKCPGQYCPFYHSLAEKMKWAKILRRPGHFVRNNLNISVNNSAFSEVLESSDKKEAREEQKNRIDVSRIEHKISSRRTGNAEMEESKTLVDLMKNMAPVKTVALQQKSDSPNKKHSVDEEFLVDPWAIEPDNRSANKNRVDEKNLVSNIEREANVQLPSVSGAASHASNSQSHVRLNYGNINYIYNADIGYMEDNGKEFKMTGRYDENIFSEWVEKYVSGFLNSKGGTLYVGITDAGKCLGIRFSRKDLDDIRVLFDRKLKKFSPAVRSDQCTITAVGMIGVDNRIYKDYYILEIQVTNEDPTELYFTDMNVAFIRKNASTILLRPSEIKDEIKVRLRRQLAKDLVRLVGDPGFDESLKKQTEPDLRRLKEEFQNKIELINEALENDSGAHEDYMKKLLRD